MVTQYRPISLLNIGSKIFERCIKRRLVNFLDENKILNDHQYGFRSTTDAILEVVEEVYPALDSGQKTAAVLMDLSRAFDMVDHAKLIKILGEIGITGTQLNLFKSYLEKRNVQVKLYGHSVYPENNKRNKYRQRT